MEAYRAYQIARSHVTVCLISRCRVNYPVDRRASPHALSSSSPSDRIPTPPFLIHIPFQFQIPDFRFPRFTWLLREPLVATMGRSEPPFIYDRPTTYSFYGPPDPSFNPKAVTQASRAPPPPRPTQKGPLVNINRHPDSVGGESIALDTINGY
jgi:hypothetical protein